MNLDAIIGKYRVRLEKTGLVLTHEAGISFELTPDEARALGDFINAYRQTLGALQSETDPPRPSPAPQEENH